MKLVGKTDRGTLKKVHHFPEFQMSYILILQTTVVFIFNLFSICMYFLGEERNNFSVLNNETSILT